MSVKEFGDSLIPTLTPAIVPEIVTPSEPPLPGTV